MTRMKIAVAFSLAAILFASVGHTQEKKITMTPVTYDGLKQEILKQRGKVVVVDLWGDFCLPCKTKGFPAMKELHNKYAAQGLTILTVAVDDPKEEEAIERANKFLIQTKAPFRHVHLIDTISWQDRFSIKAVPCYYIFDRNGRWIRYGGGKSEYDYDVIENTIKQMLNEK